MSRRPVPELPPGTNGLWRDPALRPLSSEHHDVLVQALSLKRASQAEASNPTVRQTASAFLAFHRDVLLGHESDEEEVLLPRMETIDPEAASRIREEHRELEAAVKALAAALDTSADLRPLMGEIGQALDDHVRFEERAFFMTVQGSLSTDAMAELGAALEAHRTARGVRPGCALPGTSGRRMS